MHSVAAMSGDVPSAANPAEPPGTAPEDPASASVQVSAPAGTLRVLVVTGISGAGKSTALRALEDIGYYCVDNLPLPLVEQFVNLLAQTSQRKVALGIDARAGEFLHGFRSAMADLRRAGHSLEVLFLDAADEVLLRRFSETRRRLPLHGQPALVGSQGARSPDPARGPATPAADDLRAGIQHERQQLMPLRDEAHTVVDTGDLTVHQLKRVIQERYGEGNNFALTLISFGFKHGLPAEADLVLDVRFLPNPYFLPDLSPLTGLEEAVSRFVLSGADAQELLRRIEDLLAFYLPRAQREGKAYFTIAIGCTGGRHRSVAVTVELFNRLQSRYQITVRHRELGRILERK
jgi:UPF0042 nucleotide-binding protein